jgi:hypothetical protein
MTGVGVTSAVGEEGWGVRRFLGGTGVSIEVTQKKTGSGGVCGVVRGENRQKGAVKGIDGVKTKGWVRRGISCEEREGPLRGGVGDSARKDLMLWRGGGGRLRKG